MQDGDRSRADFAAFVQSSGPYLSQTAFLLAGDRDNAADLVQEALARTYAAWWRVRRGDALRYARKVLVNLHIDQRRRHRPVTVEWTEIPSRDRAETAADDRDEVRRLLDTLPPQQRQVIVLRYFDDLPEAEVAGLLGISVGAVKSASSRGLAALRSRTRTMEGDR